MENNENLMENNEDEIFSHEQRHAIRLYLALASKAYKKGYQLCRSGQLASLKSAKLFQNAKLFVSSVKTAMNGALPSSSDKRKLKKALKTAESAAKGAYKLYSCSRDAEINGFVALESGKDLFLNISEENILSALSNKHKINKMGKRLRLLADAFQRRRRRFECVKREFKKMKKNVTHLLVH